MVRAARCALAAAVLLGCFAGDEEASVDPVADPLAWVDPFIGTGGFGFACGSAFPGAAAPHGLVKLGPDTRGEFGDINFLHDSGYWADDDTIVSFTHMHLHGAGLSDYGLLAAMPARDFDPTRLRAIDYAATFDKAGNRALLLGHVPLGHLPHRPPPLYDLIAPDSAADTVRSLLLMNELGGAFPRWPIATGESGTMLGASADVVMSWPTVRLRRRLS